MGEVWCCGREANGPLKPTSMSSGLTTSPSKASSCSFSSSPPSLIWVEDWSRARAALPFADDLRRSDEPGEVSWMSLYEAPARR